MDIGKPLRELEIEAPEQPKVPGKAEPVPVEEPGYGDPSVPEKELVPA